MAEEVGKKRKNGIDLDIDQLVAELDSHGEEDDEPPSLEVVTANTQLKKPSVTVEFDEEYSELRERIKGMKEEDIHSKIGSVRNTLQQVQNKLPDKGEKLKMHIKELENELERRKGFKLQKDGDGCNKSVHSRTKSCFNICDDFQEVAPKLVASTKPSVFASKFCSKMDKKEEWRTPKQRDSGKLKSRGSSSQGRKRRGAFSREAPSVSNGSLFVDADKHIDKRDGCLSACSQHNSFEDLPSLSARKRMSGSQVQNSDWQCNKGDPVVLDDEDEIEFKEITPSTDAMDDCTDKDTRIYYPSRDDPEAIEISFKDLQYLDPEAYLSSTIMNFYIRYMWGQLPTDREKYNYHFFNTYFYEKLKEAVQPGSSKETSFTKFRRWWKGVNIFEKAFILLPIHDHLHWSLVVICITDKEDRFGPLVLHLDSLGLHDSDAIFRNIKKFLIEEWKYLNEREVQMDLPLQDAVWKKLPRRIHLRVLQVPRQGNDYDCGLFVLYFMKKFIEDFPERLKTEDSSNIHHKIDRKWFSPKEPSALRHEIRIILRQLFKDFCSESSST